MGKIEDQIAGMRARLRKEVGEAMKELGDVVSEIRQGYAELKPELERNPNLVSDMLADVLVEDVPFGRYLPKFVARWIIGRMVKEKILPKP